MRLQHPSSALAERYNHDLVFQTIPAILMSESFNEGKFNRPWGGGDWNEYQRGHNERRLNEKISNELNNRGTGQTNFGGNSSGRGGGGGGCALVIALIAGLAIVIPSAVAALVSTLLIITLVRIVMPSISRGSFKKIYISSFFTICTYVLVATAIAFLYAGVSPYINGIAEEISPITVIKYFYFTGEYKLLPTFNLIVFHTLCILLSAIVLKKLMREQFAGIRGYGQSVITTGLVIMPSLMGSFYLIMFYMLKFMQEGSVS